jgi:hypothetical protein
LWSTTHRPASLFLVESAAIFIGIMLYTIATRDDPGGLFGVSSDGVVVSETRR